MLLKDYKRLLYWKLSPKITRKIECLRYPEMSVKNVYMEEFDRTKSIFIHIPKVAGKSISQALYGKDPRHHSIVDFINQDVDKYINYYTFSFVRNPWSRFCSIYFYLCEQNKNFPNGQYAWLSKYKNINDFVLNALHPDLLTQFDFFKTQFFYLSNVDNAIAVDYIGKFEDIDHDFAIISKKLGVNRSLPHIGKARFRKKYYEVLSVKSVDRIGEVYERDLVEFGYRASS
jgi:hypothetical protein